MSEEQGTFIELIRDDFKEFKEDVRHEYDRMRTFLLAIIGILLTSIITIAFTHLRQDGETQSKVATLESTQKDILEQAASKESTEMIMKTYENQTEVMERFFPDDIQGAVKEINRLSAELRKEIMANKGGIVIRGSDAGQD